MQILLILALIKLLELSRFNITELGLSRSFYDLLSLLLLAAFTFYLVAGKYTAAWEKKVETAFCRTSKKWTLCLDIVLIILIGWLILKITGYLYSNPIRCRTADMLPMIRDAAGYFIQGQDPFTHFYCPWQLPYVYLPMMLLTFLPAVFLKIDIRFISLTAFALLIPFIYRYYRAQGYRLTGFLLVLIILASGLFPLLLLSVHTFPYLLLLAVLCYALLKDKDGLMFFSLATALFTRKFFWFFLPLFAIYILKQHKINWRNLCYFCAGCLLGSIPYLLFPNSFFRLYFDFLKRQAQELDKSSISLKHSLGFAYHLQDHGTLSGLILIIVTVAIFVLAIKYLKKSNMWLFMSLICIVMLYFQTHTRSQEYYFLQLLIILIFIPHAQLSRPVPAKHLFLLTGLIPLLILSAAMFFPLVSDNNVYIKPIWGHMDKSPPGELWSQGFIELSIGANFLLQKDTALDLQITRLDYRKNTPVQVDIAINTKKFPKRVYQTRKIDITLPWSALKEYCYAGANQLEIQLSEPEAFSLKILPVSRQQ